MVRRCARARAMRRNTGVYSPVPQKASGNEKIRIEKEEFPRAFRRAVGLVASHPCASPRLGSSQCAFHNGAAPRFVSLVGGCQIGATVKRATPHVAGLRTSETRRSVQTVSATPPVIYRLAIRSPRSFAGVD
jgi:hypothetical protein